MSSGDLSSNPQGQQTIPNVISATQLIDLDLITVSQEVDLDEMESQIAAILQKTNFITVSQAVNLDTIESDTQTALSFATAAKAKTDFITVTAPINLDNLVDAADISKLNFLTVTQNIDLDWLETEVLGHTSILGVPSGSTHLGLFDSSLLPDNQDVKDCLAALASAIETTQAGTATLTYTASPTGGSLTAGGNSVTVNAANSTNAGLLLPADFAKLALISVSSSLNLSALATDVAASKLKTDLITVSTSVNLNTLSSDLAFAKGKTDLLTVTASTNLDTVKSDVATLQSDVAALQSSGGITDLSYTASPSNGVIASSTGDDATLPLATTVNAGLLSPGDKTKLDSVASGATANSSDAALRARSSHTGTQTASTISDFGVTAAAAAPVQSVAGKVGAVTLVKGDVGLSNVDNTSDANKPISAATQTALNAKQNSLGFTPENAANKGIPSGYASLGLDGKIPSSQLPEGGSYQGTWNATTNTPTIVSATGTNGDFYLIATAGTTSIDGINSWTVGDQIRFNGTAWEKIPNSQAVSSVAGKTGAVTLDKNDVGLGNVLNVAQVASTRLVSAGSGLTGGGDLSADRTISAAFGTTAGTVCQGNDARLSDARTPTAHTHVAANVTDFASAASAAAPVQTVAGRTGAVTLAVADVSGAAPLASPTFTGTPAAPTPATGDNTTKIATTAFVKAQNYVTSSGVTSVGVTAPLASTGGTTPTLSISAATTGAAGSMSAADKTKLDRVTIAAPQNIDTIASNASDAKGKTDFISVTQAVNLDTMESDLAGVKTKVDHISVSQAVNLDTLESDVAANNAKTQHITVTQAVNLDTIESDLSTATNKTSYITVNTPVNLNNHQTTFGHLTVTGATNLDAMRDKLAWLTLTQSVDLDAIELDVTQHQSLLGVADGSTHLGSFTNRDATYPTLANNQAIKAAFQSFITTIERGRWYNVLDYGADPSGVADSRAAIQACMDAAYNARTSISSGSSSSINDQFQTTVYFPKGKYKITGPLVRSNHCVNLFGDRAVIFGSDDFHTNFPYGWALECSEQTPANYAMVDTHIKGICFAEFRRILRLGTARNNVNVGRILVEDCKFIGLHDYPSLGIRIFNRSADAVFYRCTFDCVDQILDQQSCDKVAFYDCRCQLGAYHEWAPNYTGKAGNTIGKTSYLAGDAVYVNYGGSWKLYECVTPNSDAVFTVGKWTYIKDVDDYTGLFRVQRGQLYISNFVGNPVNFAYQRPNPYAWALSQDFLPWKADSLYIEGDIVKNAWDTGGNTDVYWVRKTGEDGYSRASWDSTERDKWQIINAPRWTSLYATGTGHVLNDLVQYFDEEGTLGPANTFYYYRCTTPNSSGTFTAGQWSLIETTSLGVEAECFSVWNSIRIADQSFFGAEGAGIVPVIWNSPNRDVASGFDRTLKRRYISQCYLQDSYFASGKTFGTEGLVPAVLLIDLPQVLVIENNMWNDSYRCVAAAYKSGATPPTRDFAASNGTSRANCYKVSINGNYGGTAGTVAGSSGATVYRDYSPNWAPLDLIVPRFPQYSGASAEPVLTESDWFRANNSTPVTHYGFIGTEEGKRFSIYFETANHTLFYAADHIRLNGNANVTPPAGSWMTFEIHAGVMHEVYRSFKETYSASNVATDRTFDANATSLEELADVVGTLIADLRKKGVVA